MSIGQGVRAMRNGRHDVDMTTGSTVRHLLAFAFPLLLGNIFQQLYNMVDTWVVGNYVSNEAFSAVGSVGPIINTLIGFFMGLASGAGAVISQYYGAKQSDKVKDTVHTSLIMTFVMGILFTVIGILMTPFMLQVMNTPDDVFPQSKAYLTIYFAGILGLMVYNMGSGILRAVGDSRTPFYFLVISAIINTVLDLFFVLVLNMGVEGVALATVIAQTVSAVLVIITLMRTNSDIQIDWKHFGFDTGLFRKIVRVGFPAALQMAITSFSNVFVQSYINAFGADGMSGWTAFSKIDQLILLPMQSIALGSTTFVAQNLGDGQVKRAKSGVKTAVWISVIATLILMLPVIIFAPTFVAFFNGKAEVVSIGALLLRCISPFYLLCCLNQIYAGALRGAGNSRVPTIMLLSSFVVIRQIYLFVASTWIVPAVRAVVDLTSEMEMLIVAAGYPLGWICATTMLLIYFYNTDLTKTRLVDTQRATAQTQEEDPEKSVSEES